MAYTQADLDAINAAIAQGALRVRMDGREIIYRSYDEMIAIARSIQDQINPPAKPRRRNLRLQRRGGW